MENFPFHPPLVHFPIAFYFLELLLLILWAARKDDGYRRFARLTFRLGYFFMILAMLAGLKDTGGFEGLGGKVRPHFYAAMTVLVIYSVRALFWKFGFPSPCPLPGGERGGVRGRYVFLLLTSAVVGNFFVFLAAFLGGKMVYG